MTQKVLFVAGGTGGHMFPAAAVAAHLKGKGHAVHFITDVRGARYLTKDVSQSVYNLSVLGRRTPLRMPLVLWQMMRLTLGCFWHFVWTRPDRVVGFGGYVTYPVLWFSRLFRVPYFIHEQNSVMGKVNRWFSGDAELVMTSFPKTLHANDSAHFMGMPVREELRRIREQPYTQPSTEFHIFVVGGSQGASVFSKIVPLAMALLPATLRGKLVLVQQCSADDVERIGKHYAALGIKASLAPFYENVAQELASAHLVITRSGASTMAELSVVGRPAVFVPYPDAMDDHQTRNTEYVVSKQAGWVIPQTQFTPEHLAKIITDIYRAPAVLTQAVAVMKSLGQEDATEGIAHMVMGLGLSR